VTGTHAISNLDPALFHRRLNTQYGVMLPVIISDERWGPETPHARPADRGSVHLRVLAIENRSRERVPCVPALVYLCKCGCISEPGPERRPKTPAQRRSLSRARDGCIPASHLHGRGAALSNRRGCGLLDAVANPIGH
jgi:hypothetical protein